MVVKSIKGFLFETSKELFYYNSQRIIKKNKETGEESDFYIPQKSLRLVGLTQKGALFFSSKEIIFLNPKKSNISVSKLKAEIKRIRISNRGNYVMIFTTFPRRFIVVDIANEMNIIADKRFREMGLEDSKRYIVVSCFQQIEELSITLITYKNYVHVFDLFLTRELLRLGQFIYLRTFLTTVESVLKDWEDLWGNINSDILGKSSKEEIQEYHILFNLKPDFSNDELKKSFRQLIKKYHPDINKSEGSIVMTRKICEAYNKLKVLHQPAAEKTKPKLFFKVMGASRRDKTDHFSFVTLINSRIYFGTNSGRVIGIDIKNLKIILSKQHGKNQLLITDLLLLQDFYFKSPVQELNAVYNIYSTDNKLVIETSTNRFARIESKSTQQDRMKYLVPL